MKMKIVRRKRKTRKNDDVDDDDDVLGLSLCVSL